MLEQLDRIDCLELSRKEISQAMRELTHKEAPNRRLFDMNVRIGPSGGEK